MLEITMDDCHKCDFEEISDQNIIEYFVSLKKKIFFKA